MTTYAIIVAGGRGERMGSDVPKQYLPLMGRMVIEHSIEAFLKHPDISGVIVVCHPDWQDKIKPHSDIEIVTGGSTRQQSVFNGLKVLEKKPPKSVLIHDAARPGLTQQMITDLITALKKHPAVIPGLAVADTIKKAVDGTVIDTISRQNLYQVQTPQAFHFKSIFDAHQTHANKTLTDDAALIEENGGSVEVIAGLKRLHKITTPDDLDFVETMMSTQLIYKTGQGFDVHKFKDGDEIILGGIKIPFHKSLEGHSDADVVLHAITDAILGAIGEGDIGQHFPPSDKKWKNADSKVFLEAACKMLQDKGAKLTSLDVTIIGEEPKVNPHRLRLKESIATIMQAPHDIVNIKATTTEQLGFTGRKEGLAAMALATISLNA